MALTGKQKKVGVLIALVALSGIALWGPLSNAAASYGDSKVVKVSSFEDRHLLLNYKATFKAVSAKVPGATAVNVTYSSGSHAVLAGPGEYTGIGQITKNSETDDPASGKATYATRVVFLGKTEPGVDVNGNSHPVISWVNWYLYPSVPDGGSTQVEFELKIPGHFTKATLETQPYQTTWMRYSWSGWAHKQTAMEPKVSVFDVKKGL